MNEAVFTAEGFIDPRWFVADLLRENLAPAPILDVDEWARANRILPRGSSSESGPFRVERTPYARQILKDLSDSSPFEDVVLMMATQLIKSECGLNWLGSIMHQGLGSVLMVQATVDTSKRFSKQRITPMINGSPRLREVVKDHRSRDSGNTILMKEFAGGCFLIITGANAANGLASMPARFIHFDERDDYPDDVGGQGEPTAIARARQDTFRRKCLISSSPKREKGLSRIEAEFKAGTRFYYHVPCPHCDELQRLVIDGLVMRRGAAVYRCAHCGTEIEEHEKETMFAEEGFGGHARWIAEDPEADVRSYHLSSLYSPYGWLSWKKILDQRDRALKAKQAGDDAPWKTFLNTRLAETYAPETDKVAGDDLKERAEDYRLRVAPRGALFLTCGVDVQDDRLEASLWAYGEGEESWALDHVVFNGDPGSIGVWDMLDGYLASRFAHESGAALPIAASAIDTGGHYTHQVYAFVRKRRLAGNQHCYAIKGAATPGQAIVGRRSRVDINLRGEVIKNGVSLWTVGTDTAKDLLHGRLRLVRPGPGYVHFSIDLEETFFAGMASEQRVRRRVGRVEVDTWERISQMIRNEPWDCAVYALFCAHRLGLHRFTPTMWQRQREWLESMAAKAEKTPAEARETAQEPSEPKERPWTPPRAPGRRGRGFAVSW